MRPNQKTNIVVQRGITSELIRIHCKDGDEQPVALTGWTAYALVKAKAGDLVPIFNLAPEITNAEAGEITLKQFSDEETAAMTAGEYVWDLVLETNTGDRIGPIAAGRFSVRDIVTFEPPEEEE